MSANTLDAAMSVARGSSVSAEEVSWRSRMPRAGIQRLSAMSQAYQPRCGNR